MVFSQLGNASGAALDLTGGMGNAIKAFDWGDMFNSNINTFNKNFTNGFGNIFSSANDYFNKNSNAINNFGTIAGALGDGYSAYNTAKTAKDMYNFQKSRYALSDARQKRADDNLSNAWANSSYARG